MLVRRQFLMAAVLAVSTKAAASADPWAALRQGQAFVLLRHARAPGTGDPAGFALGDCTTQRNLSQQGREQARRIGMLFRRNGISEAQVYSSQWCRCLDTASGLDLGPTTELPLLNSFFGERGDGAAQTQALRNWLRDQSAHRPRILVTHQVNITGLTSVVPASGELLFVSMDANGDATVLSRLATER